MSRYKHDDRHNRSDSFIQENLQLIIIGAAVIVVLILVLRLLTMNPGPDHQEDEIKMTEQTEEYREEGEEARTRFWIPEEETEEEKIPRRKTEATTEEEEKDIFTEEDFYAALKDMGEKIQNADLPYNGNAGGKTFRKAKDFNCALFVSWTLQELKLLPEGKTFWFDDKGHGSGYKYIEKHKEKFEIYHPNCPITNSSLVKPGDICGMKINGYAPHTAVFAGRDSKGHMLWYSAGRTDFKKMAKKGFKPVRFKYYEQNKDMLYTIVRIKFDKKKKDKDK